jgi:hypothetical protein
MKTISELSDLTEWIGARKRVAFIGPSGMGKSFIGEQYGAVHLDDFGSKVDGKWVIDPSKVVDIEGPVEGTSDNVEAVLLAYNPDAVVYVHVDDPNVYRKVMLGKAFAVGVEGGFYKNFVEGSLRSDREIRKYLQNKELTYSKFIPKDVPTVRFLNKPKAADVGGFHEPPKDLSVLFEPADLYNLLRNAETKDIRMTLRKGDSWVVVRFLKGLTDSFSVEFFSGVDIETVQSDWDTREKVNPGPQMDGWMSLVNKVVSSVTKTFCISKAE